MVDTYKAGAGKCLLGTSKWVAGLLRELLNEAQLNLAKKFDEPQTAQTVFDDCDVRMKQIKE